MIIDWLTMHFMFVWGLGDKWGPGPAHHIIYQHSTRRQAKPLRCTGASRLLWWGGRAQWELSESSTDAFLCQAGLSLLSPPANIDCNNNLINTGRRGGMIWWGLCCASIKYSQVGNWFGTKIGMAFEKHKCIARWNGPSIHGVELIYLC